MLLLWCIRNRTVVVLTPSVHGDSGFNRGPPGKILGVAKKQLAILHGVNALLLRVGCMEPTWLTTPTPSRVCHASCRTCCYHYTVVQRHPSARNCGGPTCEVAPCQRQFVQPHAGGALRAVWVDFPCVRSTAHSAAERARLLRKSVIVSGCGSAGAYMGYAT